MPEMHAISAKNGGLAPLWSVRVQAVDEVPMRTRAASFLVGQRNECGQQEPGRMSQGFALSQTVAQGHMVAGGLALP